MVDVFQQLADRGFVKQCTNEGAVRDLLRNLVVTFYAGFDPTADSLHVGSLMPIMAMAHLQRAGHKPIAIIGGGTAMIGDPSGKTETRRIMSAQEIESNGKGILSQLQRYLTLNETDGLFINNADWLLQLNYIQFLREIGRYFKVNEMIKVDTYKKRLDPESELGLSFIEFNYQLLQAYDFLQLFQLHHCLLQVGGDDQWSNIIAGVDLTKDVEKSSVYGLTFPLLTTALGQKMGKTEKGTVWLDAKKTSPYEFHQYWVNVHDDDVARFLAFFTFLPMSAIEELTKVGGEKLREAKQVLAFEVTRLAHGEAEAAKAQGAAQAVFSGAGGDASQLPMVEIVASRLSEGVLLIKFMEEAGIVSSQTEARRLVSEGAIALTGRIITSFDELLTNSSFLGGPVILRRGKKKFYRIVPTTQ